MKLMQVICDVLRDSIEFYSLMGGLMLCFFFICLVFLIPNCIYMFVSLRDRYVLLMFPSYTT